MCDFHSVIVTGEGRILHLPCNSHSSIAAHNSLDAGLDAKWWECEWDGRGSQPSNLVQTRGKTSEPTQAAIRAAEQHYAKLAEILAGDRDLSYPFDGPDYADVQKRHEDIMAERAANERIEPFAESLGDLSEWSQIKLIRAVVDELSLSWDELANGNVDGLLEEAYREGYESACENLYTEDYVNEQIEDAKDECREEFEAVGYGRGYLDAKRGKAPEVNTIANMPSFLF